MVRLVLHAHHKILSACLIGFIALTAAFPAPAPKEGLLDIINRLQKKYSRLRSISADFEQVYHAPGSGTVRQSGHVWLRRPRRMRWEYTRPEKKVFISDGKMVYFYVPADRQVTREKIKNVDDLRLAFVFILGRLDLRRYFYRIELTRSEAPVQAGDYVLRLTPKKRYAAFAELIVEVIPSTLRLVRVSIIELGGARSDFLFSAVQENVHIPPSRFNFTIPPNVSVLDAR